MKINPPYTVSRVKYQLVNAIATVYDRREAVLIAGIVFEYLKNWSAIDLIMYEKKELSDFTIGEIEKIGDRLLNGEPIQYITGKARFYGMDLDVSPAVLIPRQETEELVDIIVDENKEEDLRVLDIGTGSGAIAIALSRNLKFPSVTAIDISPAALKVAEGNARARHANIRFLQEDVFSWMPPADSYDIIVSNPPYVIESEKKDMEPHVLLHEPAEALFVPDSDPLRFYRRIAEIGITALSDRGKLYFEINPLFAVNMKILLEDKGYADVRIMKDISRRDRFISAVKKRQDF